jgi:sulfur-oxidizing protein SoxA
MKRATGLAAAAAMSLLAAATVVVAAATDERRSGFDQMTPATQAMQRDDSANPGMLWVGDGETLWRERAGSAQPSCADCHGETAAASMRGVAARYPAFDEVAGRPIDLEQRINACRERHQGAPPLAWESDQLLALTAYVARQSRGLPIAPPDDPRLAASIAAGRERFAARQGQLNLSCSICHDEHAGQLLAGSAIPQGHPTGYPLYRLEWQGLGSLQRRLRNCLVGMRAEPHPAGAPETIEIELYLMWRATGMPIETPAVRP